MNHCFRSALLLLLSWAGIGPVSFAQDTSTLNPKYRYLADAAALTAGETVTGPSRVLDLKGRKGINPQSIHTVIKLGAHNLNDPKGTVVLWFFALEDLAASFLADHMAIDNKHFATYAFLSDFETPRDVAEANFSFEWNRFNEFRAKFFKGTVYPRLGFDPPQKAWVQAVPFNYFQKHRWYQLAVSWDDAAKDARLYVNGILIGTSDRFNKDFHRDKVRDVLYSGCPALCHGEVALYEQVLRGADLHKMYRDAEPDFDPAIEKELKHRFEGTDLEEFTFKPDEKWTKQFDCDFQKPEEQLKEFYVQGWKESVKPEGSTEGLLIETPDVPYGWDAYPKQMYLWSNRTFEGNIYVEFERKALKREWPRAADDSRLWHDARGLHGRLSEEDLRHHADGAWGERAELSLGILSRDERRAERRGHRVQSQESVRLSHRLRQRARAIHNQ